MLRGQELLAHVGLCESEWKALGLLETEAVARCTRNMCG